MLSYYNKYYTRLQVLYYATLALGYTFQGRMKGGGVQTPPPPPPTPTHTHNIVSEGKRKRIQGGGGTC